MEMAGANLQLAGGRAMRRLMAGVSGSPLRGAGIGALTAFLVNSSSVTAVVVVGLAGAGLLALAPALAVMAGGGVGSALTIQLIAFKVTQAGPLLVAAGVAGGILAGDRMKVWSRILLSVGLVFLGMGLLTEGMGPVGTSPLVRQILSRMHGPLVGFLFGFALTVATGSSSATVIFLMALAQSAGGGADFNGFILPAATGAVLGANVGTCVTPWVASRRGVPVARQAATTFLFYKVFLAALLLPLAGTFGEAVAAASGRPGLERVIANLHLAVNLVGVSLVIPFAGVLVRFTERILPASKEAADLMPRYLDPESLRTPEVALGQARHEILRFASTVQDMVGGVIEAFSRNSPDFNRRLADKDERVDRLQRAVTQFLSALMGRSVTNEQSERAIALIGVADDLESIGDVVVRDLLRLSAKKTRLGQDFSREGWEELKAYHARVTALLEDTLRAFDREDPQDTQACLARADAALIDEGPLRRSHIARLSQGLAESRESSAIHLDVLHCLRQIAARLSDLNRTVLGKT
jgi:phosphate:Na+ symporter